MKFKKIMAFEVVKIVKGEKAAKKAQENFEKTVQNKEIDHEAAKPVSLSGSMTLREFLKNASEGKESSSQIKRVVEQGGVEVNGKKIVQPDVQIDFKSNDLVKYGKRTVYKIL